MKRSWVITLALVAGCARATTPPLDVSSRGDIGRIRTIVVMQAVADPEAAGDLPPEASVAVSHLVLQAAMKEAGWRLVPGEAVFAKLPAAKAPEERAGALAKAVHADVAVTATIARYRERVGSAYGATAGASVSLQIFAVPAGGGEAQWRARYAITQEPLAYNLWNLWGVLRGGPKWLTADELARIGVDEAVDRFAHAAAR